MATNYKQDTHPWTDERPASSVADTGVETLHPSTFYRSQIGVIAPPQPYPIAHSWIRDDSTTILQRFLRHLLPCTSLTHPSQRELLSATAAPITTTTAAATTCSSTSYSTSSPTSSTIALTALTAEEAIAVDRLGAANPAFVADGGFAPLPKSPPPPQPPLPPSTAFAVVP